MPVFFAFTAYLASALAAAAAIYYPLYSALSAIPELPPHKILTRAGMLIAAGALVFFLRRMGLASRQDLGYAVPRRRFITGMAGGWLAGIITMAIPFALLVALGVRELRPGTIETARVLSAAAAGLAGGFLVGFIEETFFRGALYAGIRRRSGIWPAATLSALLFASLHFIRPQAFGPDEAIGWHSGFTLLLGAFDAYAGAAMWDSFVALFAVGLLLALLRAWHGSIAVAVGIHAGWILVIKIGKTITRKAPDSPLALLSGSYDGVVGWLVTGWLVLLIAAIWRPAMKREKA